MPEGCAGGMKEEADCRDAGTGAAEAGDKMVEHATQTDMPIERAKAVLLAAQVASGKWGETSPDARAGCIGAMRREIVAARDEIVDVVSSETGKTTGEALHSDVLATLEILLYLERNAERLLRPEKAKTPFVFGARESYVEYKPLGVVLVIAPWNNPLQLALVPAASALVAGNAVLLKPSERTPRTGKLISTLCRRAGLPDDVLQVVDGGPDVAQALIDSRPDIIFFTGGTKNGRSVLEAASRQLIPVILELGGKDPMIVFADAHLDRAAQAAVYGAFSHAGQHCVSVKRLYVQESVYGEFLERVAEETRALAATSHWGRVMDERAQAVALEQVQEAVAAGARLLVPDDLTRAGAEPTLVRDATNTMRIMREETFAPVLSAMPFEDEDDAVRLANDSEFGLNASVWSDDATRAKRVAHHLETGNVYVNNVLINIGNPHLPFGGVKSSGLGRYHGPEGVRAFCNRTAVMVSDRKRKAEPNWFPHDEEKRHAVEEFIRLRYGDVGFLRRIWGWLRLLRRV